MTAIAAFFYIGTLSRRARAEGVFGSNQGAEDDRLLAQLYYPDPVPDGA